CTDVLGERIVGVAIQMSNQNTLFGGRSAQGLRIACATVTIAPNGTASVGPVTTQEVSGSGLGGWSPSTWTAMTPCLPGYVVTGLIAHTGTTANLFVDVSIMCSQLGANGAPATTSQTIKIVGSQTNVNGPTQAQCDGGEVLSQLGPWTGYGLDGADLSCSLSACR